MAKAVIDHHKLKTRKDVMSCRVRRVIQDSAHL